MNQKTIAKPWACPVDDDWQWGKPITPQDHQDYHDDPVYDFNRRTRLTEGKKGYDNVLILFSGMSNIF